MEKPTIGSYMIADPVTIGADQPLARAHEIMRARRVRHLPVLSQGRLVGIVSDRDLRLVENLKDVDPTVVTVEEAMTPDPFTIGPDSSLEWVAMEMAQHKYGSTLVVDRGRVVGVFTTVDALRALQGLLADSRRREARRRRAQTRAAGSSSTKAGGAAVASSSSPPRARAISRAKGSPSPNPSVPARAAAPR
jgi:acetoin utilization protein AcuB